RDCERMGPDLEAAAPDPDRLCGRVVGKVRALQQPRRPEQRADEIRLRCRGLGCGGRAITAGGRQGQRTYEENDHKITSGLHGPSCSSRAWGVRTDSGRTACTRCGLLARASVRVVTAVGSPNSLL